MSLNIVNEVCFVSKQQKKIIKLYENTCEMKYVIDKYEELKNISNDKLFDDLYIFNNKLNEYINEYNKYMNKNIKNDHGLLKLIENNNLYIIDKIISLRWLILNEQLKETFSNLLYKNGKVKRGGFKKLNNDQLIKIKLFIEVYDNERFDKDLFEITKYSRPNINIESLKNELNKFFN